MATNNAIKNAARARQAETGESYTDARAAVVADHDKPVYIALRVEAVVCFKLDTPEARKAWRELPPALVPSFGSKAPVGVEPQDAYDFAREHLGEGFATMLVDSIEYDGASVDIEDVALVEVDGDNDDTGWAADAVAVSDVGRWYRR